MDLDTFLDILPAACLCVGLPLLGLVFGAVVAPALYATRFRLALLLNLAGLVLFVWLGSALIGLVLTGGDPNAPVDFFLLMAQACSIALAIFLVVEGFSFLLLRCWRRQRVASPPPPSAG